MPISDLKESSEKMRHWWDDKKYPTLVYVETTNFCNARCTYCLYERMERPIQYMNLSTFKKIADKVKARGLKIGAMFCFGEPLADKTLFKKIEYGRSINVLTKYLGMNTNCTLLTVDKYEDILSTCSNLTLSFPNTEEEFEKLTNLNWDKCYNNALDFIAFRDKHKPNFNIQIGCNDVTGHNRGAVSSAFKKCNINWARDAEIKWGSKVITGVIDRSKMYHNWVCDGYKGAIQIKPNGDCCFCAYDVIRNETCFANILTDSWDEIESKFKKRWKEPSSLCLRCDFWWNYYQLKESGWSKSNIDHTWQASYDSRKDFWEDNHKKQDTRYLTGTAGKRTFMYHQIQPKDNTLIVGVGKGRDIDYIIENNAIPYGLDIAEEANSKRLKGFYIDVATLPSMFFEVIVCHLVIQHMNDIDLIELFKGLIHSLTENGTFSFQYASNTKPDIYKEGCYEQQMGLVRRSPEHIKRIVEMTGGKIVKELPTKYFTSETVTDDACWNFIHVERDHDVRAIGR